MVAFQTGEEPMSNATGLSQQLPELHEGLKNIFFSEGRLSITAAVLDSVHAAIIITDTAGTIAYWNSFAQQLYGWKFEEVARHNIMELIRSSETEGEAMQYKASLAASDGWSGEVQILCRNATYLPAVVALSTMFDKDGKAIGIVGVSQDLTAVNKKEEELTAARAQLEKRFEGHAAELELANQGLRQLSARLLQLQDEERRRLARELHDSVGQMLAAVKMNSSVLQSLRLQPEAAKCAAESDRLLDDIIAEVRTISHLLHPPLLDEVGLPVAVKCYVEGFSERSRIAVTLDMEEDIGRLGHETEIALFRILQEGLTNVHRHSGSRSASVRLAQRDGKVRLEIIDRGKGIPAKKQLDLNSPGQLGVGFRGMRERVLQIGGNLEIHSGANGTTVVAIVPVVTADLARVASAPKAA
jgi:PAS domain S-box-containing protein